MNKKDIEEIVEEFQQYIPKPDKHYSVQADWKDWINAEDWLRTTLTELSHHHEAEVQRAVEAERERVVVHIQRKGYDRQFAEDFISPTISSDKTSDHE